MEHNKAIYLKSILKSIDLIKPAEAEALKMDKELMSAKIVELEKLLSTLDDPMRLTLLSLLFVSEIYRAKHETGDMTKIMHRVFAMHTFMTVPFESALDCYEEGYKALTKPNENGLPDVDEKKVYNL